VKTVFFGGGSHRFLGIARSVLAQPGLFENGEIYLYDLDVSRAEAVGRMIMLSPEYAEAGCRVRWGNELDEALDGADAVIVVLMAGGVVNHQLCRLASNGHGFIGSDQLSPSGAMLALKGGPILMNLAKRMEQLCPNAWIVDFANPVAVLSAAVNNHTRIRCLGVCAGYTNHQWDLTRLLYGKDEAVIDYDVRCAGVNHMGFILPGSTHRGRDLYELAAERLNDNWVMPPLSDRWSEAAQANITRSVTTLLRLYRKYGYLVFSTEGDGLAHLDIESSHTAVDLEAIRRDKQEIAAFEANSAAGRARADREFQSWLTRVTPADWSRESPETLHLLRCDEDLMVKVLKALGGCGEMKLATSFPNRGAVSGFKDRTVLEYSQVLGRDGLRPMVEGGLEVPDLFQGLVSSLATHQTLLGDAIATRDPRVLFEALYSYPVKQDTADSKALWRDLLVAAGPTIPAEFQKTRDFF
jgi:alpha-galactosidase/6-phospho-beta-glucosidase family protein